MSNESLEDKFKKCSDSIDIPLSTGEYNCLEIGFNFGYELAQKEMQEKLDQAIEVIKFYARPESWSNTSVNSCDQSHYDDEYSNYGIKGGKRARAFLKELESEK